MASVSPKPWRKLRWARRAMAPATPLSSATSWKPGTVRPDLSAKTAWIVEGNLSTHTLELSTNCVIHVSKIGINQRSEMTSWRNGETRAEGLGCVAREAGEQGRTSL